MTTRKYSSRSQQTTLTSAVTSGATVIPVANATTLLGGVTLSAGQTFTVVIDPDTALEEIVELYSAGGNPVSGNNLTVTRAVDMSGASAQDHSAGAVIRHMIIGRDLREANLHIEATTAYNDGTAVHSLHGLGSSDGDLVGTAKAQPLTNKTIDAGSNTITGITSAMITDGTIVNADINASAAIAYSKLNLAGAITSSDITNDTIVNADINTAAAIAATKIAGTAITQADNGTVTSTMIANGTIVDADISGSAAIAFTKLGAPTADFSHAGYKITNLGTPTATADASTKGYVDTAISNLIGGAPSTLDTLNEIAAAINNSGSFATSVVLRDGTQAMTGALAMGTNKITGLGNPTNAQDAATKYYIDNTVLAPSNLTGPITSTGNATAIASQTGTGTKFVVDTSPTLVTPVLGVATATSINGTTIPSTKTLVVTTDNLSVLASTTSAQLAGVISDETGTGSLVFGTSPAISDPKIAQSINAQTGTTYTFVLADQGKYITASNASAQTYSIPTNASVAFPVGTSIDLIQIGAGQVTVSAATPGTTTVLSTGATAASPKTRVQYSALTCKKIATDTWHIIGDIA
jgi:hypothetical protein